MSLVFYSPLNFISCDWGTTNIRLKVIETETPHVLADYASNVGVKSVFKKITDQTELNQFDYFYKVLIELIYNLPVVYQDSLIVISGMASSIIGMFKI
ncbi:2-dehydro-3-deoxygalactonokinase [Zobellia laminariae]|uniref:2-dehydro-3-deoxygalactonokinase n=1 Tax=Zobellia laminariae TaxID=248906 RepID=UPI0012D9C663|nr:hypothetical protein [Zobellia laminariae]